MRSSLTVTILRRAGGAAILLLLVLTLTFLLLHLAPGDPTTLLQDPAVPRTHQQELRRLYGLDRPLHEQYLSWLRSVVALDWGVSFRHHRPVTAVLADHLPNTLLLAAAALLLQFGVGLGLGASAARHAGSRRDHWIRIGSVLLYSLPLFWVGLMAILALGYLWPLFPPGHMRSVDAGELGALPRLLDLLRHLALPALVLGLAAGGATSRFVRNNLLEVFGEDFIRTARAKGLGERRVVWVHALRNSAAPLVQLFGLSVPFLLSGSLVIEVVFSWPGIGRLTYDAIQARDYPLILAGTALTGSLVVVGNLIADLLQIAVDPRLRDA